METGMKHILMVSLLGFSRVILAQAPVEERPVKQPAQQHTQIKADFARTEKEKAADRLRQAESEVSEARRAQQVAEKNLQAAQQRLTSAQQKLTQAQAQYQQAKSNAAQSEAAVGQAWKK
jgi:uncharacterized protein (DUF3084 family)